MIAKYNRRSLYWGIPGAWLHLCSAMTMVAQAGGGADSTVSQAERLGGMSVVLLGTVLLMIGFYYYARAKGRTGFWWLFGLIGPIGIVVLVCLKDITQDGIEATAQE